MILLQIAILALFLGAGKLLAGKMTNQRIYALIWEAALFLGVSALSIQVLGLFEAIHTVGLFIAGVIYALIAILLKVKPLKMKPQTTYGKGSRNLFGLFALCTLLFSIVWIVNQLKPVHEVDSLGYHLPIVYQLLESGSIWDVFHAGFVGPNTYFPANHEAIQVFLHLATGTNALHSLVTLLGILLMLAALKALERNVSAPRRSGLLVGLLLIFIPSFSEQLFSFQVDLYLMCLFTASLSVFLIAFAERNRRLAFLSLLIFGIALGTKYNALSIGVIYVPFAIGLFLYRFGKWKRNLPAAIVFLTIPGGFWYIRNWIIAGNPFFPFTLWKFQGHERFMADMAGTSFLEKMNDNSGLLLETFRSDAFSDNMGQPMLLFLFLALAALVVLFIRRGVLVPIFLAVLLSAQIFLYLRSPYTGVLFEETFRYSMAIWGTAAVLILAAMGRNIIFGRLVFIALPGLLIYTFLNAIDGFEALGELMDIKLTVVPPVLIFFSALCIFLLLYFFLYQSRKSRASAFIAALLMSLALFGYSGYAVEKMPENKNADDRYMAAEFEVHEQLFSVLQKLRSMPKGKIALAGVVSYGIFIEEGFDPLHINIDGCIDCKYHDYKKEPDSVRAWPNEAAWLEALKRRGIHYLLVGNTIYNDFATQVELVEREWAQRAKFEVVFDDGKMILFRLL